MQLMKRDHLIRILNASILKNGFYFSFIRLFFYTLQIDV